MKQTIGTLLSLAVTAAAAFLLTGMLLGNRADASPQNVPPSEKECSVSGSVLVTFPGCPLPPDCTVTYMLRSATAEPSCGGCSAMFVITTTCGSLPAGGGVSTTDFELVDALCDSLDSSVIYCSKGNPAIGVSLSCGPSE